MLYFTKSEDSTALKSAWLVVIHTHRLKDLVSQWLLQSTLADCIRKLYVQKLCSTTDVFSFLCVRACACSCRCHASMWYSKVDCPRLGMKRQYDWSITQRAWARQHDQFVYAVGMGEYWSAMLWSGKTSKSMLKFVQNIDLVAQSELFRWHCTVWNVKRRTRMKWNNTVHWHLREQQWMLKYKKPGYVIEVREYSWGK